MQAPDDQSAASGPDDLPVRLLEVVAGLVAETRPGRRVDVSADSDFERELGLDSLARVELGLRVSRAFGASLPEAALTARTPRELLEFVSAGRGAPARDWRRFAPLSQIGAGEVPQQARTLVDVLQAHAARHPERLHVLLYGDGDEPQPIAYGQLYDEARHCAAGLAAHGLQPQQSVALMLPTGRDYLVSFFAVLIAGGVPVPIYPPARLSQIEEHLQRHGRILDNAQCVLLVTVPEAKPIAYLLRESVPSLREIVTPAELAVPVMALPAQSGAEDIAFLQYTSGSTGDPKGVVLTHANLLANIRAMGEVGRLTEEDVWVSWLPLYHDMGLIGAWFVPLYFGFPLVLMSPLAFLARPARWLQAIHRHRGTLSGGPNFAYELVAHKLADADLAGLDLSCWRVAFNGAEPVSPATLEAIAERLAPFGFRREALLPVYGLAECSVCLAVPPLGRGPRIDVISREAFARHRRAEVVAADSPHAMCVPACGMAIPGHAMRVVDEEGFDLPERRVGRLQFAGPSAARGYFRNPQATAGLLSGDWRETGDTAYLADGEVFLTGRVKDLIIRGGRNLYPYELEQAVGEIPGVRKGCVAVFGSPDPANGTERVIVLAETRETDPQRREALRTRIGAAAADAIGLPADDIVLAPPHTVLKTSSGKIRRGACRELYERGLVGAAAPAAWWIKLRLAAAAARSWLVAKAERLPAWAYAGWAWAIFLLLAPPTWALVAILRRPRLGHYVVHCASRLFLRLAGIRFESHIGGRLPARAHVLAVNHGSYLDTVFLAAALPPRLAYAYVAKREFEECWYWRWFFSGLGTLMVERFDVRRGVEGPDQVAACLASGRSVVVFPEGTFTPQTGVRAFRTGAFVAAARAQAPVVTAGIAGVRAMLRDKTWMPRRGRPRLNVGAIIAPGGSGWSDAVRLRDAARAEIVRLSGEPDLER